MCDHVMPLRLFEKFYRMTIKLAMVGTCRKEYIKKMSVVEMHVGIDWKHLEE